MAEDTYLVAAGHVQKFGDKPAVNEREVNGQTVRDVTIKALGSQKLIRITIWPELNVGPIKEKDYLSVEGKYTTGGDQGQFHNISATAVFVGSIPTRAAREVVNQPAESAPAATPAGDDPPPF